MAKRRQYRLVRITPGVWGAWTDYPEVEGAFIEVPQGWRLETRDFDDQGGQVPVSSLEYPGDNPKDAIGSRKAPMSTVPAQVLSLVGLAMLEGALKYGRHNYRVAPIRASVYYDACMRHLVAHWEGEDIDPDSNLPHLVKAMACLVVWMDAWLQEKCVDDRPPKAKLDWDLLHAKAHELMEKYPNPKEPYTHESGRAN